MNIEKQISKILMNPRTHFALLLTTGLILSSQGFAEDNSSAIKDLDSMTNQIRDFLFGPVVRKIGLTLGMGAGLIQAFISGSIRPLLIYGGLGLVVGFLPALIEKISMITG